MKTKKCSRCQKRLGAKKFYKDITKKIGLRSECKLCTNKKI